MPKNLNCLYHSIAPLSLSPNLTPSPLSYLTQAILQGQVELVACREAHEAGVLPCGRACVLQVLREGLTVQTFPIRVHLEGGGQERESERDRHKCQEKERQREQD